ncbi:RNA polymerase factor sigma-54 [bacterium]|nr:RNA polymerase factor sigma-54 [bacterium]
MPKENDQYQNPSLDLDLSVRQEQRLTQQQRQALALLQQPRTELEQTIRKELDTNPALEEFYPDADRTEDEIFSDDFSPDGQDAEAKSEREKESEYDDDVANDGSDEDFALNKLSGESEEWRDYYREEAGEDLSRGDQASMQESHDFIMNSLTRPSTLSDELRDQFALDLPGEYEPVYDYLLASLDEKGFLTESPEEMAAELKVDPAMFEKCLELLKSYDPPGLGARDLRESFLFQLERRELRDSLPYLVIKDHYDDLLHQRFERIMSALKINSEQLKEALEVIRTLDLRPGRELFYARSAKAVADVIVREKENGEFEVETNDSALPYVRISKSFRDSARAMDKKARTFASERIAAGKNFISQLQFCKRTILRVAEAIVEHQKDFLKYGPGHMKPLTMHALSQELDLSDSTVSRTISGKYMDTPQGLMEMKAFFSRAAASSEGVETSGADAKSLLMEIVAGEDKRKPYGDDELAAIMAEKGCPIARRTVVKYREALGIPKSRLRRKIL